jgi:hypothetical protein
LNQVRAKTTSSKRLGDLHIDVAIRSVVMEKYPTLRRNRPANFYNTVRAQLIRGNLRVVRCGGTTEKSPS